MLKSLTRPRRVVITGMGCVTPLGIGREAYWSGLVSGKSGVRRIEAFDPSSFPVQIAAEVPSFDWQSQLNPKDRKHVPRTVPLALAAAREALEDAKLFTDDLSLPERRAFGVELGTGGGGLAFTEQQYEYWYVGPTNKASVYTIPAALPPGFVGGVVWGLLSPRVFATVMAPTPPRRGAGVFGGWCCGGFSGWAFSFSRRRPRRARHTPRGFPRRDRVD